jgi:enoyl-CoA hydratase/carnithine racemase
MTVVAVSPESEGVVRVTLNRPEKANALNEAMVDALIDAIAQAEDGNTRLLILDAAGKNFCAGFDLSDIAERSDGDLVLRFIRIENLLQKLYSLPFPTLALAKGRAMGAGADVFCACSQRIAAPGTTFRMPGLAFGIVLGTRRLVSRVGVDTAREIQNETRAFDADEAKDIGFATRLAAEDEWPMIIDGASTAARTLQSDATRALFNATAQDTRTEDMADLVLSAAKPGLKDRIQRYIDAMQRAR